MKIRGLTALFFALVISLVSVGCSEDDTASSKVSEPSMVTSSAESEPTTDVDVPVENIEQNEQSEESEPIESEVVESEPPEPVYVGVEKITLSKYSVTVEEGSSDMPIVTMHPTNATDKGEIWTSNNTKVATVNSIGRIKGVKAGKCVVTVRSKDNPDVFAEVKVKVKPYVAPVEPEITYIDGILIANKTYPLPSTYNPGVNAKANAALKKMFAAAKKEGLNLFVRSGFRSYSTQKYLYNSYVKRDGKAAADRYSARPGHSEHQTGLAFDINKANSSFAGSPEAKWLAKNCHKYGFIIRYPKGKESITGYIYEPWHVRYLGIETATSVYDSGLCLEEYLGITSKYKK